MASVALYSRIEQETGYTADWRQTGSIRIAMTGERVQEFGVMARGGHGRSRCGVPGLRTAGRAVPAAGHQAGQGRAWCPTDGYLQPHSLVMAYARAALTGVTIAAHTTVTGITVTRGAVTGVRTSQATPPRTW